MVRSRKIHSIQYANVARPGSRVFALSVHNSHTGLHGSNAPSPEHEVERAGENRKFTKCQSQLRKK